MYRFCGLNTDSRIFLAPLAGFSDAGFRALCVENGAGVTYTEMVSAKGMCYMSPGTEALLYRDGNDPDCIAQIFGSEPEFMRRAAADERLASFPAIDINMGCPVRKVFSNGDGSALMLKPELIRDVVAAVVEGSGRPVTVKIRAGIKQGQTLAVECALAAQEGGASAVCVHPRYREQMYGGVADHEVTAAVKAAVSVPVIASGDITDARSYLQVKAQSHADFFMIGRGALGKPWIFGALNEVERLSETVGDERALAESGEIFSEHSSRFNALDAVKRHIEILLRILPPRAVANSMKMHLCHYAKNTRRAKEVRMAVAKATSVEDIVAIAERYFTA